MAQIYSDIISGMMDAFASVISNNLNVIMKLLASVQEGPPVHGVDVEHLRPVQNAGLTVLLPGQPPVRPRHQGKAGIVKGAAR